MARVKRGVNSKAKHKKILKAASGYYSSRSRTFKVAKQAVIKSGQYAYRDRRQRKRDFRSLWIVRVSAATKALGMSYSQFIHALKLQSIELDRKVLAHLAVHDKTSFAQLVEGAKKVLDQKAA